MRKFVSMLLPLTALAVAAPASAQGLSANMTQVELGSGQITISNVAAVCLNSSACDVPGSFTAPDEAGRGMATVVTFDANPGFFSGKRLCITGVGQDWAAAGFRIDPARVQCAVISGGQATVPFQVNGSGVFGIVPLIVDGDRVIAWGSHPFGQSRYLMTRPNGERDLITLLVSSGGSLRAANADEAADYAGRYASLFQVAGADAETYDRGRRAVENR